MGLSLAVVAVLISLSAQVLSQTTSCPEGKVYSDCGSACPATCNNRDLACIAVCVSGCFCPRDQVLLQQEDGSERCVNSSQCPGSSDTDNTGEDGDMDGDGGHDGHGDGEHNGRDGCKNCREDQICKVMRHLCHSDDAEDSESSNSESSNSESSNSESDSDSDSDSDSESSESDCVIRTYSTCVEAPYVSCGSDAFISCDSEFLYCLQHNKTRRASCVASCISGNGNCGEDEVCTTSVSEEGRISLQCQDLNDLSSECPAGQHMNDCGDLCQGTCEDHLSGGKPCIEICGPPACVCPRDLVLFRDRCVDPRLCYVLMKYQPEINPLPLVSANQYLYSLFAAGASVADFDQDSFLSAVQQMLTAEGFSAVTVDLHGIHQDQGLQIVIQLSGDNVNEETSDQFTSILKVNSEQLPFQISDVSKVDVDRVGKEKCFFRRHKILVAVGGASIFLIFLSIVMAVISCCLCRKKKRVVPHRKLKMEFSDVMGDDTEKMKLDKELEALS